MKSRSTLSKQINNIIFKSLYYAALIGILVYILLLEVHNFNYEAIATYYEEECANDLQSYVESKNVISTDNKKISEWSHNKSFIELIIFDENKLVYSDGVESQSTREKHSKKDIYKEIQSTPKEMNITSSYNRLIKFSDGKALRVYFLTDYYFELKNFTLIFSAAVGVICYTLIFMKKFKDEINYINILSDEVALFEKNELDNDFTIRGENEITNLARTLSSMRTTISEKEKREIDLNKEQEKLVTGMTHDLRTPMTGLSNYIEVLKQKNTNKDLDDIIERISDKVADIGMLSEQLFEYFIVKNDSAMQDVYTDLIETSVGEYVSEMYIDLLRSGFNVVIENFEFGEQCVKVSHVLLNRIMSNILSNINKYAAKDESIVIESNFNDCEYRLYFRNKVSNEVLKIKGTKVGVENIKTMMKYMDGYCIDTNSEHGNKCDDMVGKKYFIMLAFKIQC